MNPTAYTLRPFGQAPLPGRAATLGEAQSLAAQYVATSQPDLDEPWVTIHADDAPDPVGWIDGDGDYREGARRVWRVVDSMRGYLPEGEGDATFYSAAEARQFIADELRRLADDFGSAREAPGLRSTAAAVEALTNEESVLVPYVYCGADRAFSFSEVTE